MIMDNPRVRRLRLPREAFDPRSPPNVLHAVAVVRTNDLASDPIVRFKVQKVVFSRSRAQQESERLNQLNRAKGVEYHVMNARIDLDESEILSEPRD
ncbi:MAG: hypothetical protein AMXMBFR58_15050 [Phycisphaerae bacterium]